MLFWCASKFLFKLARYKTRYSTSLRLFAPIFPTTLRCTHVFNKNSTEVTNWSNFKVSLCFYILIDHKLGITLSKFKGSFLVPSSVSLTQFWREFRTSLNLWCHRLSLRAGSPFSVTAWVHRRTTRFQDLTLTTCSPASIERECLGARLTSRLASNSLP